MGEELCQRLFVVLQVDGGHQVALDDLPGLAAVVGLGAAGLEGVERHLDGLLHGQRDGRLAVLEVHGHTRPRRLTLVVVQL